MTAQELIKKYGVMLETKYIPEKGYVPTGRIYVRSGGYAKKMGDFDEILSRKPEIMGILIEEMEEKERKYQERQDKINAIPGLAEIQAAKQDLDRWNEEWEKSFDDVGGLGVRPKPEYDFAAMNAKYPRAAAYLKAESYSHAAHDVKASAGQEALEKIINGEDYEEALKVMEDEWSAYCDAHVWD